MHRGSHVDCESPYYVVLMSWETTSSTPTMSSFGIEKVGFRRFKDFKCKQEVLGCMGRQEDADRHVVVSYVLHVASRFLMGVGGGAKISV